MEKSDRPLSPHLQIYRLPLTAVLSITHRITGVLLTLGLLFFVAYLMAVAAGADEFGRIQALVSSPPGRVGLWVWIFAFFLHFCHGIRHLTWDAVKGLEKADMDRFAYTELAFAVGLTVVLAVYVSIVG